MTRRWSARWPCAVLGIFIASAASAQDETPRVSLGSSFKSTGIFDRDNAEGLARLRLEPGVRVSDSVDVETAVDQRMRAFSSQLGFLAVVPGEAPAPYRIRQLDWSVASGANGEWRLEIDRAALHVKTPSVNLTAGRQAIGWGRGVLFSAVDLFSPFTPLEADREWRRGVDAVRADVTLADRVSLDSVAAFGTDVDHGAFATRLRGYAGKADVEIVGGRRSRDMFAGATTSAAVGDAEVHGEFAAFDTPDEGVVTKAVAGGSYRAAIGSGILWYVEYHYSGFTSLERYLHGDTQILQRHAIATLASYEFSPEWSSSIEWIHTPTDGAGVIVPSAILTFGDRSSLVFSIYAPYGNSRVTGFVQFRFYR